MAESWDDAPEEHVQSQVYTQSGGRSNWGDRPQRNYQDDGGYKPREDRRNDGYRGGDGGYRGGDGGYRGGDGGGYRGGDGGYRGSGGGGGNRGPRRQYNNEDATTIKVPSKFVGRIIGRGGSKINDLQLESGARINVTKEVEGDETMIKLFGDGEAVQKAESLIRDLTVERDGPGYGNGRSDRQNQQW